MRSSSVRWRLILLCFHMLRLQDGIGCLLQGPQASPPCGYGCNALASLNCAMHCPADIRGGRKAAREAPNVDRSGRANRACLLSSLPTQRERRSSHALVEGLIQFQTDPLTAWGLLARGCPEKNIVFGDGKGQKAGIGRDSRPDSGVAPRNRGAAQGGPAATAEPAIAGIMGRAEAARG
jgi:hypothetical protein